MAFEDYFAYDDFRPGQRDLCRHIYDSCIAGEVTLVEAPSGFGKTAAVLAGAISAAHEFGGKLVYCCRTKRQILRVVEELTQMQKRQPFKSAALFSKFDYCLLKERAQTQVSQDSFGWFCGFNVSNNLCSYFLNTALVGRELDVIIEKNSKAIPNHIQLMNEAAKLHVCPYELARLAASQSQVLVIPYHYIFDPSAKNVLLSVADLEPRRTLIVVDEAHNLRDFLRSIHSTKINMKDLDHAIYESQLLLMNETTTSLSALREDIWNAVNAPGWFLDRHSLVKVLGEKHGKEWLQNLAFELTACTGVAWESVGFYRKMPHYILKIGDFLTRLLSTPDAAVTKWDGNIGIVASNPVRDLAQTLASFRSATLLSATISPSEIFIRSLGIGTLRPRIYVPYTQRLMQVTTIIDTGVTTRYKSRTLEMYRKIAERLDAIALCTPHGIGVFMPSYVVLEPIFELISKELKERCLKEERGMTNQEASDLIDAFVNTERPVLFGVQGGRFSEGEDFKEDLMGTSVVVGLSIPPPTPLLYAEYAHLKWSGEPDSYLMLSLLPALRKALQAAGRHLRAPGKKGMVFLLDSRFNSAIVDDLLPSWLKGDVRKGDFEPNYIRSTCSQFWST